MIKPKRMRWLFLALIALTCTPVWAEPEEPTLRTIEVNDIQLRIAEMGEGPLVILVHGWPESWYSWRHQLKALADAGYHAVAPDMRGYGHSGKPQVVEDYDIEHLTGDLAGIVDALGEEQAILVGHDWGAIVTWHAMLYYPETFTALAAMSVPYDGRSPVSPVDALRRRLQDNFFYILYFQEWNVAEREFDADPRAVLSRLYTSPDTPREAPEITNPKRSAGGWIPRRGAPKERPDWLTEEDLDYFVAQFTHAGFRGGINYYRNMHRNWELTAKLESTIVQQPVTFIAGEQDMVIRGASAEQLTQRMTSHVPNLQSVTLIPEAGHWVQQEKPEATNALLLDFLNSLK